MIYKQFLMIFLVLNVWGLDTNTNKQANRKNRVLGVFTIVSFPNSYCASNSRTQNGTCYTSAECTSKGGESSGTCANSFGVCCIFSGACGSSVTENNTYHSVTTYSSATNGNPCTYTVCPVDSNVCKLRIDFDKFAISGPFSGQAPFLTQTDATTVSSLQPKMGQCEIDSFSVVSSGTNTPPVICGINTGQHMYVDVTSSCAKLNFNINENTVLTRSWDVRVTQIECGSEGANHDCLQYFTGTSGKFSSFNYKTVGANTMTDTAGQTNTHLAEQNYDICFRRETGYCKICFSPSVATPVTSGSFGVSSGTVAAIATSTLDGDCTGIPLAFGDYIEVTNLVEAASVSTDVGVSKICGAIFNAKSTEVIHATACSFSNPFKWGVNFDGGEALADNTDPAANQKTGENYPAGGITGFQMDYWQQKC